MNSVWSHKISFGQQMIGLAETGLEGKFEEKKHSGEKTFFIGSPETEVSSQVQAAPHCYSTLLAPEKTFFEFTQNQSFRVVALPKGVLFRNINS